MSVAMAGAAVTFASDGASGGQPCSRSNKNKDCRCDHIFSQEGNVCVSHDRTVVDKRFYS
eukprot:scaffold30020_cov57-Attheya_sp.AAC.1